MSSSQLMPAAPVCPVCKSRNTLYLCKVDGFDVWRCPESATDFVSPMPDAAVLKKLYDREAWFEGGERGGYSDYDEQTAPSLPFVTELLGRFADRAGPLNVLDVGCGYGSHLQLAHERGWNCFGIEPSAHARAVCEQRHGDRLTIVETAEDLLPLRFDLVLMFEVIEHLQDPYALFFTLFGRDAIGPDTLVVISTPNARSLDAMGDPAAWAYRHPPSHLVFYSAESLRQLLERLLFKDIQVGGIVPVQSSFSNRFDDEQNALNDGTSGYMGVLAQASGSSFKEFMHERYVPGAFWKLTEYEHFPRYSLATKMAAGARALDFGCGTGYGTAKLCEVAASVVGMDISEEAIHWARSTHRDPRLEFVVRADLGQGMPAASFDLVTCFEMIEHVDHAMQMDVVRSISRLLKPGGKLVMSTPDPQFTAPYGDNPYHLREMSEVEFLELLQIGFKHVTMLKQWVRPSVTIASDALASGHTLQAEALNSSTRLDLPVGFIAICSNEPFEPPPPLCLFETAIDFNWETLETEHKLNRLRFKNHQWAEKLQRIQRAHDESNGARDWLEQQRASWESLAQEREHTLADQQQQLARLHEGQQWLEQQRDTWESLAQEREQALADQQQQLARLHEGQQWLEQQRDTWESLAQKREQALADQQQQLARLHEGQQWLEQQRVTWESLAQEREQALADQQQQLARLHEGQQWLEQQRVTWESLAQEREQALADQQRQLARLHEGQQWLVQQRDTWESLAQEREQALADQQQQLARLHEGQQWLVQQRDTWESLAQERERALLDQQQQLAQLLKGQQWLSQQRDSWESLAREREQNIANLSAQYRELSEGNAWLLTQSNAWELLAQQRDGTISTLRIDLQHMSDAHAHVSEQRNSWEALAQQRQKSLDHLRSLRLVRLLNWLSRGKLFNL